MAKVRAHLIISGYVQGVFFRETMRREANIRGVTGWVRNLFDGQVEAVIEGDEEKVKQLIEWCKVGPPAAEVDKVDIKWEDFVGEFSSFFVRR